MRGVLLFAFNNGEVDYVKMAYLTSQRVHKFLNLSCTLVTDKSTEYKFDNIVYLESDPSNTKHNKVWINKGRYNAYELSPYDETLVLDVDYVINSDKLNTVFDFYDDFCIHNSTSFLMYPNALQEKLSPTSFETLWATVFFFKKSQCVRHFFTGVEMVQQNYQHYINLHGIYSTTYRNDYAFTIANRIVNGHLENVEQYIPWNLIHAGEQTFVERVTDTEYKIILKQNKTEYIIVKDTDFHMMNKNNFMELFDE
jgi:hypothetical protein